MINYDVIKRPIITEKTNTQKDTANQVTFEVDPRANRIEVQRAVEKIFNVKVAETRTMHVRGKFKRRGRILGKRRDWKKAIVTLKPGERIEFFEGA
ncbi:50S ribosomal protein L23 [Desulfatitalea alkaliphila]|uniref:Large ribosomal subunit protein uL23 n=1 Tax=Desulfatitalea alkaliphila TaxID=2929485 RepID=A0AA41R7E5_9BACT|nr:50S ribosomal protein L23 [Desulfatitalea alkaliphila]MCJ8502912.1 50S ribosomal protein L23 [Desulfatitalea alkaliphila]